MLMPVLVYIIATKAQSELKANLQSNETGGTRHFYGNERLDGIELSPV